MDEDRKFEMLEAMRKYGGSFVVSLADCFMRADSNNFKKLCAAFPEYVEQYLAMADRDAAQQSAHGTGDCCCNKHYPGRTVRCLQCPIHGFDPVTNP